MVFLFSLRDSVLQGLLRPYTFVLTVLYRWVMGNRCCELQVAEFNDAPPFLVDIINYSKGDKYIVHLPGIVKHTLTISLREMVSGDGQDNPAIDTLNISAYLRTVASMFIEESALYHAGEESISGEDLGKPLGFINASGRGISFKQVTEGETGTEKDYDEVDGLELAEFGIVLPSFVDTDRISARYNDEDGLLIICTPHIVEEVEEEEEYVEEDEDSHIGKFKRAIDVD